MPFDYAPGVYSEEAAPVALPVNVGSTLVGFIGTAKRGPMQPRVVTKWSEFVRLYGGFRSSVVDLGVHLREFFDNGGTGARLLRVSSADAVASTTASVLSRNGAKAFDVSAISPGEWGDELACGLVQNEVVSTAAQALDDGEFDLPNNTDNTASVNTVRVPVDNINRFSVGDVVDVFTSAGVHDTRDPMVVLGIDAAEASVVCNLPANRDVSGAGFYLRSASQHRVKTFAKEGLADAQASILLDSVNGIYEGSILTLLLYSHVPFVDDAELGQTAVYHVIVDRVSGDRVYFTAAVDTAVNNNETIPASSTAKLRYKVEANNYITFSARDAGPAGNRVRVIFDVDAANALAVSVSGKTITIACDGTADTIATVIAAIEASAAADALVSVANDGSAADDTAFPADDLAVTNLAGGARLLVFSQEFGLNVYLGEDLAERHDYLSTVPTSPDFVEKRLGGDPDTYTPVSGSQSQLIIVDGADATVGTAAVEFLVTPRALASVGLSGGDDGSELTDDDWIGGSDPLTGLKLLGSYEDIKLIAAPGITSPDVQRAAVDLAIASGKFVVLLDPPSDALSAAALISHRRNDLALDTSFAQLASSWAYIRDRRAGALRTSELLVPPTPAWAALIAVGREERGPHGSCGNRIPASWLRLAYNPGPADAKLLGNDGITGFRVVAQAIRCFDDLTLLTLDDPRKFGNVRRMLCQLESDIEAKLAGVAFDPGNEDLFAKIESLVGGILKGYHESGALRPRDNAAEAYHVTCNAETTTEADIAQGVFYVEIAVKPSTLARTIVARLSVAAGGARILDNV